MNARLVLSPLASIAIRFYIVCLVIVITWLPSNFNIAIQLLRHMSDSYVLFVFLLSNQFISVRETSWCILIGYLLELLTAF